MRKHRPFGFALVLLAAMGSAMQRPTPQPNLQAMRLASDVQNLSSKNGLARKKPSTFAANRNNRAAIGHSMGPLSTREFVLDVTDWATDAQTGDRYHSSGTAGFSVHATTPSHPFAAMDFVFTPLAVPLPALTAPIPAPAPVPESPPPAPAMVAGSPAKVAVLPPPAPAIHISARASVPVPAPMPAPAPQHVPVARTVQSAPQPDTGSGGAFAALRRCESGDNYRTDTGNGYYGAYQFSLETWSRIGERGLPSDAPAAVQDEAAQRLQSERGWRQWPSCSRQLGL